MEEVRVIPLKDVSQYKEVVEITMEAWGLSDYYETVPPHLLKAAADNGGVVLAAYRGSEMAGFVFGFLGMEEGRLYHYSHQLAVRTKYRGRGVALKLKLAQRDYVLKQGLDLIMWTYDPHMGRNARFNFAKLGVIARRFYENYYGILTDELNRGMPTDRFKVEWWIKSARVLNRIRGLTKAPSYDEVKDAAREVVKTRLNNAGIRSVARVNLRAEDELLLVEVPGDLEDLKSKSLRAAIDWKLRLRPVFKHYLSRGYVVVEFITLREGGERRNFYLLWRTPLTRVLRDERLWK
ncbi:MAG TPA: GNAT family N-acetyltransferase [Thermofilaceae archaeon]|nr:GNAT family N-acetyltransferase [Thermofilaceae archaeon]